MKHVEFLPCQQIIFRFFHTLIVPIVRQIKSMFAIHINSVLQILWALEYDAQISLKVWRELDIN